MREDGRKELSMAMIYISSIIGAGFASGQEILQFFVSYGRYYPHAVLASSVMLFVIGYLLIEDIRRTGVKSYGGFVRGLAGPFFGILFDFMIGIFYFGALSIMMAGSGSLFEDYLGLPSMAGVIMTAIVTVTVLIYGYRGIRLISWVLVPVLVVAGALISIIYILLGENWAGTAFGAGLGYEGFTGHWLLSAFLYASYNLLLALGVFTSFSEKIEDRRSSFRISFVAAVTLFFLLFVYSVAISKTGVNKWERDIPMLEIAKALGGWALAVYGISLWAAILTTAVANAISLGARLSPFLGIRESIAASIATIISIIPARMGFAPLIGSIYPAFGYAGVLLFVILLVKRCSSRSNRF